KDLGVVNRARRLIQDRRRTRDRAAERVDVDLHAVAGGKPPVPFAAERRTRIDQREIDVEEDGLDLHSWYGPAMTMAARSGSSARRAAAFASSRVTAASSDGSRR